MGEAFPCLRSNPEAEGRCRLRDGTLFFNEYQRAIQNLPRSSDLSWSRKKLYCGLVEGSVLDPLKKQLGWSLGEIHSQWIWAPGSRFLNNSKFSLTWWLAQKALALNDWAYRVCLADMPDCLRCGSGLEKTAFARLLLL